MATSRKDDVQQILQGAMTHHQEENFQSSS